MSTYGFVTPALIVGTCANHHGAHEHTDTCAYWVKAARS